MAESNKVLHICSYYIGNSLYKNMFTHLDKKLALQKIFIPLKTKNYIDKNIFKGSRTHHYYDVILNKFDRIFYKRKILKQMKRIEEKKILDNNINMIHAHTLFSDGGTAYYLKRKLDINYILNVRNTDINIFYKYMIHQRKFSHKVLINASAIIYISPAYKNKLEKLLPKEIVEKIQSKSYVIPNGIDEQWFMEENMAISRDDRKKIKLFFTGLLNKNKNLDTVIKLLKSLIDEGEQVTLDVAGDGPLKEKLQAKVKSLNLTSQVKFHGKVSQKVLIQLIDECDIFILPSFHETFGISYIEAISRGKPVIYTRNEGIDGYFREGEVGYSTNPQDIEEMKKKIELIMGNYKEISENCLIKAKKFNWKDITDFYNEIYVRN